MQPTWLISIVPALRQTLRLKIVTTCCEAVPRQVDWGSAVRQMSKGQEQQELV